MTEEKSLKIIDVKSMDVESKDPQVQIQAFEARQRVLQHALFTGLSATNSKDWVNMGDSPYLQGSGAEKMVPCLPGLSVTNVEETCDEHEDPKGTYFTYRTKGTVSFHSTTLEIFGRASSRDKFFAKREGELLPFEEIDRNDIAGSAYTDMIRNAVVRMFGLRNLTWEELDKFGIRKDGVVAIDYKKKGKLPPRPASGGKKDAPCWKWEGKEGNELISAKTGDTFSEAFLKGCGMRKGNKGIWTATFTEARWNTLETMMNEPPLDERFPPPPPEAK